MEISISGANGSNIKLDLSDKLTEIYDSIYLEIDNIKTTYKSICKGVIIDNNKFQHIVKKILDIFEVSNYKDLIICLNQLIEDDTVATHANFIFSKLKLSDMLYSSVNTYLKLINIDYSNLDLLEKLYIIKNHINTNEFNKEYNKFIDITYKSGLINLEVKSNFGLSREYIDIKELRNYSELNSIMSSIDLIKKKHNIMFNNFKDLYISILSIINTINLILQQKASG